MRSRSRRRGPSVVSPANAEPNHFFKMILPDPIHAQDMRIPKEFVRRFEKELSTGEAKIGVPDGRVWKMELKKSEDEAWFCNGWEEFVKYYSISLGFFLAFKYEGNSQFNVTIFDASAAEIRYPCRDNSENENSVKERRRKRPSSSDQSGYNRRSQRHKKEVEEEEEEEEIIDIDALSHGESGKETDSSRKREKEKDRSGQGRCSRTMKRRTQRALEAAQNFKPANESFTKIVTPQNLNRYYVDVPASFWREKMRKKGPKQMEDSEGRKWEVNYGKRTSSIRIRKGWNDFAKANNVKEGDECVFELIKRKKGYAFKVTVIAC